MSDLPTSPRDLARRLLPRGSRRRDRAEQLRNALRASRDGGRSVLAAVHDTAGLAPVSNRAWLAAHRAAAEADELRDQLLAGDRTGPSLHVVVIGEHDDATADSLARQWSTHWRPWTAADLPAAASLCARLAAEHPDDPVTVLLAGDVLLDDLVARVLDLFWERPRARMVHWDEAAADDGAGLRFRPSWSPDLLTSANPLGRAFALRARDWAHLDPTLGDDAWWDVLCRAALEASEVERLAVVAMYSARPHDPVGPAATTVVRRELERRDWPARPLAVGPAVWLDWQLENWPTVSIVVPTRHNRPMLERLLPSLVATDYPRFQVVVVDNSGRPDADPWYDTWRDRLELEVVHWDEPFNYSAVNNLGARVATGEVLVFLNDDTEALGSAWLRQLVGWATRPEIGTVGAQLIDPDGRIQHGGVVLGMDGSAGHLFAAGPPGSDSLLGRTEWTRDVLASTAACVAMRRDVFEQVGGFDERFVLCGSDVVLGLDVHLLGLRNVVVPAAELLHLESATRGRNTGVPEDLYASWWNYQPFVVGGDPFHSQSLSLDTGWPTLRPPGEPTAKERMLVSLGRPVGVFRQEMVEERTEELARAYPVGDEIVDAVVAGHAALTGASPVQTVNWFLPGFDNPHYGGIATILRIAAHLQRTRGVEQRFVILDWDHGPWYRSALSAAQPALASCEIIHLGGDGLSELHRVPPADAAIATMWTTAYAVAAAPSQRRRFYLVQDFEPCFYPAGSMYALAEETYRLGLYGICNTEPVHALYTGRYGGTATWFSPAVDRGVFHPPPTTVPAGDRPVRLFVYARPGHWRNCWELAKPALQAVKAEFGDRVHIVTAGSWASPSDIGGGIQHLGLLDVRATGELYRTCDIGMALTVSAHPSYLPLELMASGVPVVTFDMPEADWILHHEGTGLRARRTVEGIREQLSRLITDHELRARCAAGATDLIDGNHSDWDAALDGILDFLDDPDRHAR